MKSIRAGIVILIVFHVAGIVVGLSLWKLILAWMITLPLGFIQTTLTAFYNQAIEDSVGIIIKEE